MVSPVPLSRRGNNRVPDAHVSSRMVGDVDFEWSPRSPGAAPVPESVPRRSDGSRTREGRAAGGENRGRPLAWHERQRLDFRLRAHSGAGDRETVSELVMLRQAHRRRFFTVAVAGNLLL